MQQLSAIKEAGLYTQAEPVPLLGVSISAEIRGFASRVTIQQTFRNSEKRPIEAVYVFPLEEGSAVCDFSVKIGNRLIKGEVEERHKAFVRYDKAISEGHGGFLLDQEKPNIFVASVGNLNPDQEAVVNITYVAELPFADDSIRFMLPTTISPRYAPLGSDPVAADIISPPMSLNVPYGLSFEARILNDLPVDEVSSPSHQVDVSKKIDGWTVKLAAAQTRLDRDLILNIKLAEAAEPVAIIQKHQNGDRAIMIRFYPEIDPVADIRKAPSTIIFVLDCSGSMSGTSIEQARKVLEMCLRSMSRGDSFNIFRFGSSFEFLFKEPRPYTDKSLQDAVTYVRKIDADLGGTEILPVLQAVYQQIPATAKGKTDIIVLTDGEVLNEEQVISLAGQHRDRARIFSFGIGYGPSESLVRGLARVSGGMAEFVSPDERIEDKVLRQFSRMDLPRITDIRLDWGGLDVEQAPQELPPIFDGDSVTVYGRVKKGKAPKKIIISAKLMGKKIGWRVPVKEAGDGNLVPTLWARAFIRDMETASFDLAGSRQIHRKKAAVNARLVEIAKRYNLASSQTSFVAIETRGDDEKTKEEPVYRRVPIQLTWDWHGVRGTLNFSPAYALMTMPGVQHDVSFFEEETVPQKRMAPSVMYRKAVKDEERPKKDHEKMWFHRLLLGQSAEGYFELSDDLAVELGTSLLELKRLAGKIKGVDTIVDPVRVLATCLAMLLLRIRAKEYRDQWSRSARKAEQWLTANAADAELDSVPLMEKVKEIFFP